MYAIDPYDLGSMFECTALDQFQWFAHIEMAKGTNRSTHGNLGGSPSGAGFDLRQNFFHQFGVRVSCHFRLARLTASGCRVVLIL
jgi:hypothetical protein